MVVEVVRHPRRLYLHALDLTGPDPIAGVQQMVHDVENRVLNAFGSREEIAAFRAALDTKTDEELEPGGGKQLRPSQPTSSSASRPESRSSPRWWPSTGWPRTLSS